MRNAIILAVMALCAAFAQGATMKVPLKVRAFGASSGATLRFAGTPVEVKGLVAASEAVSGGVIENATYASSGTVYLDAAMPQGVTAISANLRLADAETRGNVAGWDVFVGDSRRRYRAKVGSDGKLSIVRAGFMVNFK